MSASSHAAHASHKLSSLLGNAYRTRAAVAVPGELEPDDAESAYVVQRQLLDEIDSAAGGWKIGAKSAAGPIQGAPLPVDGIYRSHAVLDRKHFPVVGLELEIAFTFGREFMPADAAISDPEIIASLQTMLASIEIVSSRLAGWPHVPALTQLADLQNHGALIVGDAVDYHAAFPFQNPRLRLAIGETEIFNGSGSNPAGDPRRLLPWLVRHCIARGMPLPAGSILTTGSYTGIHFPAQAGVVSGEIDGLPPILFSLV
jgi:2-keto-4-pentenoate hydratase